METTRPATNHAALIKLWPPSKSTRLMLVERIIKNLTSPSLLSRKYGLLSVEEAEGNAKKIEETAFISADKLFADEQDSDGCSAVQLYAKESSKLMMEVLKRGPTTTKDREVVIYEEVDVKVKTVFDISGSRRAFIDGDEAKELFAPLSRPGNSYTRICLSNRSFGLEAANVVGPILSSLKSQLEEVDLSDFVAGRPEEEALEVMNIFSSCFEGSKLRYLDLSNNALGEKGVRAFGSLLKSQHNLEELFLMNDGISEEAAQAVNELIPSTEIVKTLHFHNNMTGDEGAMSIAEIVQRSPLLEDFRCSSTRIGSGGGVALARSLGKCPHLKKLDLRDNMFGVEAGVALSKAMQGFANLTEIYLSYLNLEDEGAKALALAMKDYTPSLEILEMAGNDITIEATSDLASCITSLQFLTKLNLSENELKDEGAVVIAKALEGGHGQLCEVDLSTNKIRKVGARVLALAVVDKPGFKLLNIDGNFISDEGIDEVKEIFKGNPDVLAPLDENDPEGEDDDDDEEDGGDQSENDEGLELKLKGLDIKQDD